MLQNLTGWHALIVLAVVVLLFGAAKLPALARSVGQSVRILKTEVTEAAATPAEAAAPSVVVAEAAPADAATASATPATADLAGSARS